MAVNLQSITGLPNFPNLYALLVQVNDLTALDLTGSPAIARVTASNNDIGSLDLSSCPLINILNIQSNPNLVIPGISTLNDCEIFNAYNCSISSAMVDEILITLAESAISNGYASFSGGSNGIPSAAGITAGDALVARGWTVDYNT